MDFGGGDQKGSYRTYPGSYLQTAEKTTEKTANHVSAAVSSEEKAKVSSGANEQQRSGQFNLLSALNGNEVRNGRTRPKPRPNYRGGEPYCPSLAGPDDGH